MKEAKKDEGWKKVWNCHSGVEKERESKVVTAGRTFISRREEKDKSEKIRTC